MCLLVLNIRPGGFLKVFGDTQLDISKEVFLAEMSLVFYDFHFR